MPQTQETIAELLKSKKIIFMEFDKDVPSEYREWTEQAINDFISLFPEHKDLFHVAVSDTEALPPIDSSGTVDLSAWLHQKNNRFPKNEQNDIKNRLAPISVSITSKNSSVWGISNILSGPCISAGKCKQTSQSWSPKERETYFKKIVMHELGHTFSATFDGRGNTEERFGTHCADKHCLMSTECGSSFGSQIKEETTFCDTCITVMKSYMKYLKEQFAKQQTPLSSQVTMTNDTRQTEPADDKDYDEPDNPRLPELVRLIKAAYKDHDIAIRATKENQEEYPYTYNLYKRGEKPAEGAQATGRITIASENNVILKSKDINHFVVAMNAIKQKGGNEIRLNLAENATEEARKTFAAHAVIAGMIAGIEVKNNPYSLEELKELNPMIEKVIKLNKQKEDAEKASANLENNTDAAKAQDLETTLGNSINEAFGTYQQLSKEALPNFDSLKKFECGVNAVKKAKTRRVAQQILAQRRSGHQA